MSDEIDIPEPEHDHLLDHEFHDEKHGLNKTLKAFLTMKKMKTKRMMTLII